MRDFERPQVKVGDYIITRYKPEVFVVTRLIEEKWKPDYCPIHVKLVINRYGALPVTPLNKLKVHVFNACWSLILTREKIDEFLAKEMAKVKVWEDSFNFIMPVPVEEGPEFLV